MSRLDDGRFHLERARAARSQGDMNMARLSYVKAVESFKQCSASELDSAKREYADFVNSDPLYRSLISRIKPIVQNQPGLLQTDIYKMLPGEARENLSYALYFAAEHGTLRREKKGRSYAVYPA